MTTVTRPWCHVSYNQYMLIFLAMSDNFHVVFAQIFLSLEGHARNKFPFVLNWEYPNESTSKPADDQRSRRSKRSNYEFSKRSNELKKNIRPVHTSYYSLQSVVSDRISIRQEVGSLGRRLLWTSTPWDVDSSLRHHLDLYPSS